MFTSAASDGDASAGANDDAASPSDGGDASPNDGDAIRSDGRGPSAPVPAFPPYISVSPCNSNALIESRLLNPELPPLLNKVLPIAEYMAK